MNYLVFADYFENTKVPHFLQYFVRVTANRDSSGSSGINWPSTIAENKEKPINFVRPSRLGFPFKEACPVACRSNE